MPTVSEPYIYPPQHCGQASYRVDTIRRVNKRYSIPGIETMIAHRLERDRVRQREKSISRGLRRARVSTSAVKLNVFLLLLNSCCYLCFSDCMILYLSFLILVRLFCAIGLACIPSRICPQEKTKVWMLFCLRL